MTWSDGRSGGKKRIKPAIFAEKVLVKKPMPSWIAPHQPAPNPLAGWLSSRSSSPAGPMTSIPPPADRRPPTVAPPARAPSVYPHSGSGVDGVQAMEARALSFEAENVTQGGRSVFPQGSDRSLDALAPHLPGGTAFLANEAAQAARLEATITALERSVEELSLLRGRMMEETEEQLVMLATVIARRVIGREVAIDPEILLTLAAEGIDALGDRDRVVVRFGFLDRDDLLASMVERLKRRAPRCEVLQDPSLGPGQCVVESEYGQVDESVDTRLDNVLRALLPGIAARHGAP